MVGLGPLPNDHRFWHAQNNSFLPKSPGHQDWCGRPILQHLPRFSIAKASWLGLFLYDGIDLLEQVTDSFPVVFRLGVLPNRKGVIEMRDRLSQLLIPSPLHLHIIICGDLPQTIPSSFDEDGERLCNPLGISSQYETWFEPIPQHHSVYHLIHARHESLWAQVLTGDIYQLHHVEICTS